MKKIMIVVSVLFLLNCAENVNRPEEYRILSITPEWNPDNTRIAFIRVDPGYHSVDGIWMMNSDGTNLCKVIDGAERARWSKDGEHILYSIYGNHYAAGIESFSIDPYSKQLLSIEGYAFTWDYNSERVYFNLSNSLQGIGRAGVDGSNSCVIADSMINPDVSVNGDLIACIKSVSLFDNLWEIVVINPAGTIAYHTNAYTKRYAYPRISPNSDTIVFADDGDISIMNIDGSDRRVIASGRDPSWVPDGNQIVFCKIGTTDNSDGIELWVVNTDGTNEARIY